MVPSLAVVPTGAGDQQGGETLAVLTDTSGGDERVLGVAIIQVHPARQVPVALVLPRRLTMSAPGHGDLELRAVLGRGGPDLLVRTVQAYTGIDLEHLAIVDAAGVADMAAEQGGVDLCAIVSSTNCKQAPRRVVLDLLTDTSLGDDIAVARQQFAVVSAVVAKTSSRLNVLLHPFRTLGTISAAGRALRTDVDLGGRSALRWSDRITSHDTTTVEFATLPGFRDPQSGTVEAFVEQAETVLQAMRDGQPLPEEAYTSPAELSPADVTVAVLNGSGIGGLANQVADALAAEGFDIVEVGNAATFNVDETAIDFGPGFRRFAELALAQVPGATLREGDQPFFRQGVSVDLIITIGKDFSAAGTPSEADE